MELELTRVDYVIIGVNSNNCMKLLPPETPNETQKIAIADQDGILQVISIRNEGIQVHFKTLPGPKCTALQLAGASGTSPDKIFIATDNEVRGFTRRGKLFLSFDTNLTEPITSMCVLGSDLFACGNHVYNHYRDCKDVGSYLCGDRIVDVIALHLDKNISSFLPYKSIYAQVTDKCGEYPGYSSFLSSHRLISLIACEGRMIRSIEHARVTHSVELASPPTVLHVYRCEQRQFVLFGTVDGRIGLLDLERAHTFDSWLINDPNNAAAISCMTSYDLTKDGVDNLIIGRNDGNIEVYSLNILDKIDRPQVIFTSTCNESVTSLQCGFPSTPGFDEILVSTYSGRIFGLTSAAGDKKVGADGAYVFVADASLKVMALKADIEELQRQLVKERERYQSLTHSFLDEFSAIPMLNIKDSMILSREAASYTITIEVPTAIDNVLLQCDVPVDLLDVEKNSAVVSFSDAAAEDGNCLLATYRCQVNTNRLEVKIRTVEGQYGTLRAYITPLIQPKFCQLRSYEIKPLSLHLRMHHFDEDRPFNVLYVKGSFSLAEFHSWVGNCLPEVPDKPNFIEETVLNFQSTFLDTILQCKYSKGEGSFTSDNVSTICILKDFFSKQATSKNIRFEAIAHVNDESINHVLRIIDPKLIEYMTLKKNIELINALHELDVNEDDDAMTILSRKYRKLIANEKKYRDEVKKQPTYCDRLHGIITDLYIDYHKLKGMNVKSKLPRLTEILKNYEYTELLHYFRPNYI